jgi:hypothetical protein
VCNGLKPALQTCEALTQMQAQVRTQYSKSFNVPSITLSLGLTPIPAALPSAFVTTFVSYLMAPLPDLCGGALCCVYMYVFVQSAVGVVGGGSVTLLLGVGHCGGLVVQRRYAYTQTYTPLPKAAPLCIIVIG